MEEPTKIKMRQKAAACLSSLEQLETGLNNGEQWAIDTARSLLAELVITYSPKQLLLLLQIVRASAKCTLDKCTDGGGDCDT